MPAYRPVTGKQTLHVLIGLGYEIVRVRGSHHMLSKRGIPTVVVVPVHGNRTIPVGTFRSILKQAQLKAEEFYAALE